MNTPEKKLKIGFAGNTNNYPFTLALAFARLGYDIKFLVNSQERLHRPENRYAANDYKDINILDVSPLELEYTHGPEKDKLRQVSDFFNDRDVMVLNSHFISMWSLNKIPHIALLTGSDLDYLASEKYVAEFKQKYISERAGYEPDSLSYKLLLFVASFLPSDFPDNKVLYSRNRLLKFIGNAQLYNYVQRKRNNQAEGISKSAFILYFPEGLIKSGDATLKQIGAGNTRRVFNLMTDTTEIPYSPLKLHNGAVRIFNVARFNWNPATAPSFFTELDFKGNNKMLEGIALFAKKHPAAKLQLVLVRKGANLSETYKLAEQLGLDKVINWVDELTQKEVLEEFEKSDIVFDQLGTSLVAMGGLDALSVGRPLIANWRPEFFEQYAGKWPVCQATTPEQVCEWLELLVLEPQKRIEVGEQSRKFVEEKLSSEAFAKRILNALKEEHVI